MPPVRQRGSPLSTARAQGATYWQKPALQRASPDAQGCIAPSWLQCVALQSKRARKASTRSRAIAVSTPPLAQSQQPFSVTTQSSSRAQDW